MIARQIENLRYAALQRIAQETEERPPQDWAKNYWYKTYHEFITARLTATRTRPDQDH